NPAWRLALRVGDGGGRTGLDQPAAAETDRCRQEPARPRLELRRRAPLYQGNRVLSRESRSAVREGWSRRHQGGPPACGRPAAPAAYDGEQRNEPLGRPASRPATTLPCR